MRSYPNGQNVRRPLHESCLGTVSFHRRQQNSPLGRKHDDSESDLFGDNGKVCVIDYSELIPSMKNSTGESKMYSKKIVGEYKSAGVRLAQRRKTRLEGKV